MKLRNKALPRAASLASLVILFSALVVWTVCADTVSNFVSRGELALKQHQIPVAISNLDQAVSLDQKNAKAYLLRARAYILSRKFEEAMSDLTKIIQLDPTNAGYFFDRGCMWSTLGYPSRALVDLNEAIRLNTNHVGAYLYRGGIYDETGDYSRAIADETKAIELDPKAPSAYFLRGKVYNETEHFDKAVLDFDKSLELGKDPLTYVQRAVSRVHLGLADEAIEDCNQAIELRQRGTFGHSEDTLVYLIRGIAHVNKGDNVKALQDFDQVIRIDTNDPAAHANRGYLLAKRGDYQQGIADCEKSLQLNPNLSIGCNNSAWILATCPNAELRNGTRALELAKKAATLRDWNDPYCLGTLAAVYAETGDYSNAVKWQKEAIGKGFSKKDLPAAQEQLNLYEAKKPYREK